MGDIQRTAEYVFQFHHLVPDPSNGQLVNVGCGAVTSMISNGLVHFSLQPFGLGASEPMGFAHLSVITNKDGVFIINILSDFYGNIGDPIYISDLNKNHPTHILLNAEYNGIPYALLFELQGIIDNDYIAIKYEEYVFLEHQKILH